MKTFLKKFWNTIKSLFNKVDEGTKKLLPVCIGIANGFKAVLDSPVDDIALAIVSTQFPAYSPMFSKGLESVKKNLPNVILTMDMVNIVAHIEDENERLKKIVELFKLSDDQTKDKAYHDLCFLVLTDLSDGKLTWIEASALSQYYYDNIYKPSLIK